MKKYFWELKGFPNMYINTNWYEANSEYVFLSSNTYGGSVETRFSEKEFNELADKNGFVKEAFEKVEIKDN